MSFLSKLFGKNKDVIDGGMEGMQTTMIGADNGILGAEYRYNIASLTDLLRDNPSSSFTRYMLAELLLDKGEIQEALNEFIIAQTVEKDIEETELTHDEIILKKKAKAKLEKKLGYKLES